MLPNYRGMRNLKFVCIVSILHIIALSCKEVYNPPSIKNNPFILVVDGIIVSGNDSTIITLSRTKSLTDSTPTVKELAAKVSVLGKSGVSYPFNDLGNGRYETDHLMLDTTQQ